MKKVFIIVLNFNGKEDTLECLDSLLKLEIPRPELGTKVGNWKLEIVVVDNGSTDGSVKLIKSLIINRVNFTEVKNGAGGLTNLKKSNNSLIDNSLIDNRLILIENKENLGFAEGNNVGIKFALKNKADFVLILNNDTFVDKNLVVKLLKAADSHPEVGVFAPKIYFASGFEFHKARYKPSDLGKVIWYAGGRIDWKNILFSHRGVDEVDKGQYGQMETTEFASGCAMFVKREVFEKIGFFDKKYFTYLEDADFCERAKKADFQLLFVPQAVLWHKVSRTAGGIGSKLQDYYITRNRLFFGFRFGGLRVKLALVKESIKLLFLSSKKDGVVDFYLRRFNKKQASNPVKIPALA